jgi:hypothetical protein
MKWTQEELFYSHFETKASYYEIFDHMFAKHLTAEYFCDYSSRGKI